MILDDLLSDGSKLPPTRKLAHTLKVSRSTIVAAYDELAEEGFIESQVGSGSRVIKKENNIEKFSQPINWSRFSMFSDASLQDSLFKTIFDACSYEDIISFAPGFPARECMPIEELGQIFHQIIRKEGRFVFQRLFTAGYPPLRKILADWMVLEGKSTTPDEVLLSSGSRQGLFLIAQTLLDTGDTVFVESPTYFGSLQLFKAVGAKIVAIPVDKDGMKVDVLERLLARQIPKFIYTLPTFQNPSGAVLSLERRKALLELAYWYQVPIVEDDPYSKLNYERIPPPPLKVLDKHNHVIYLGTFSKLLFPGLRIGWIVASLPLIDRLNQLKQLVDLHSNSISQLAVCEFCRNEHFDTHLDRVRKVYSRKRDIMISALKKHCSSHTEWQKPEGGYHLWCRLKEGLDSAELLREATLEKVAFIPGMIFNADRTGAEWLRLNFTHTKEELIESGIQKLKKAVLRLKKKVKLETERKRGDGSPIT